MKPCYVIVVGYGYFTGFDGTEARFIVQDDVSDHDRVTKFFFIEEAERIAEHIGGTVKLVL